MVPVVVVAMLATTFAEEGSASSLLALTPVLDGRLSPEEWQKLKSEDGTESYLQWEPGSIYFAAKVKKGSDLMLSIDPEGDGWLNGAENYEVRVSFDGSKPAVTIRTLDATAVSGPSWKPRSANDVAVFSSAGTNEWIVEGRILAKVQYGSKLGAAMESLPSGAATGPAYLPRPLMMHPLGYDQSEGIPDGMAWRTRTKLRQIARDDSLSMTFELSGLGDYRNVEIRCEGWAKPDLTIVSKPFPGFSSRGTASVDYKSSIRPDASGSRAGAAPRRGATTAATTSSPRAGPSAPPSTPTG